MDPSYNNSFGMPAQSPIVSSGDVVLAPISNKKSGKAWLFVLVVLVVVAIAAVCTVLFILPNKEEQKSNGYITDFNIYANYLLYGDTKTDNIGDFSVYDTFYIDNNYENEEYLNELLAKYNVFYEKIGENNAAVSNEDLVAVVGDINSLVEYNNLKLLDDAYLLSLFKENGKDAALRAVSDFYGSLFYNNVMNGNEFETSDSFFVDEIKRYDLTRAVQKINYWAGENDGFNLDLAVDYARNMAYDVRISLKNQTLKINNALISGGENVE